MIFQVSETPTTTAAPSTDNATTTVATITTTAANSLGNVGEFYYRPLRKR